MARGEGLAPVLARRTDIPDALDALAERVRPTTLARDRRFPVLPALEPLLPGAGLRRGSTVAVGAAPGVTGATSLALALAAGASRDGSWVAAVGLGSLGLVAAAELGVALERFVVVADPGGRGRPAGGRHGGADASRRAGWPAVVAALVDGFDVVLVAAGPGTSLRAADVRRLTARGRERGAVLVAVGGELPGERSPVRLSVVASRWSGLDRGTGHLRCREATVEATGRGDATRRRRARLWLPGPDGGVETCEPATVVELPVAP
ncbi:MAG TPA: hypothetical protein VFZ68_15185 [Acidimicrobiales bacterium]